MSKKFYMFPAELISDKKYSGISVQAKLLFMLLLDRQSLSQKNGWVDGDGQVFIIFSRQEAAEALGASERSVSVYFKELNAAGLIREYAQGVNRAKRIYVGLQTEKSSDTDCHKTSACDPKNFPTSNTEINNTENKQYYQSEGEGALFKKIIEGCELHRFDISTASAFESAIENIFYAQSLNVGGREYEREQLRKKLSGLTGDVLNYVSETVAQNRGNVKNPSAYLMSTIIKAIDNYNAEALFKKSTAPAEVSVYDMEPMRSYDPVEVERKLMDMILGGNRPD